MPSLTKLLNRLPAVWRHMLFIVGLILALVTIYILHYIYTKTPIPVYALDKLKLRTLTLPDLLCKQCNNFTVEYIVHEKAKCNLDDDVFLLNFLISYAPNVRARNVVRTGWGSVKSYKGMKVKTIFVFGVYTDENLNKQAVLEEEKYGDILQGNFSDDYNHLTEKSMMALDWITQFCPQAKYILKTDDDSFNNPYQIIDYLKNVQERDFVGGYCFTVMPDRRTSSKYHVPKSVYPDMYYPTYCAGPGYILSQGAVIAIKKVAPNVKYLPMEDVYVAGMCRETANIPYTNIPGMVISQDDMNKCRLATFAKNAHNVVPEIQAMLWKRTTEADAMKDCGLSFGFWIFLVFLMGILGLVRKVIKAVRQQEMDTKKNYNL